MRWLIVMPFDRPELMGPDFATELRALGHEVRTFAYRRENALYKNKATKLTYQRVIAGRLERLVRDWRPALVLVIKGGPIDAALIARLRSATGARFLNVFPDNPLVMIDFANIEAYDLFFTKERYAMRQLQLAGLRNLHYLAGYCVPAFHHPESPTTAERRALERVIALVGARYPYRERFVHELIDYPVRIWGPGWSRASARVRALVAGPSVWGRDKLVIYSTAALSLNLHHPLNDIVGVNTRTFELAGAGACQVVDFKDDLPALFKPGEEVLTFRDLPELRRLLDHYLARPEEARAIGDNARLRALAEHTVRHRLDEIASVVDQRLGIPVTTSTGKESRVSP